MRGLTSTILLVLVLGGLGAYIYFVESERPASSVEEREDVFAVEADQLEELTVTSAGETTTLRKSDGAWKITAPIAADADDSSASSLATTLADLEVTRVVDQNASDLAQYGLAEPRLKVAFKAQGGASGELHIGDKTVTSSDMFAMKPGTPRVFLVPAYQETSLAKTTFDLRDKRILHFDRDATDTVELSRPGQPAIVLARSGTDWNVKQPVATRADYSAIEGLLTRLSSASMTELIDPNSPQTFGLEKPSAVITVGAGSSRASIEFGEEVEDGVYARDTARNLIFKTDASLAADAKKPVGEYRDKDVFEFRPFTLARLRITRGSDTYEFQKITGSGENATDTWQRVVDGKATDVDTAKMDDLLNKLSGLRAQSFNPTTNAARTAPAVVVGASYDNGQFERVRLIDGNAQAFAVREGEPGVAVLDATAHEDALKALDALIAPPA